MYILLFLIHPLTMLLAALKNLRGKHLPNVLWAFTIFYSMSIGVEAESGSDIVRYMAQVEQLYHSDFTLQSAIGYYYNSGEVDIIRPLLSILVSRFTDNGYILVILFGVIFGFFFSRNITFVIRRLKGKLQWITIFLLCIFFLLDPIWEINGFRFWTATHMFLYGLLPFLFEGKKRPLFWCVLTPFLLHFSFFLPVGILAVYLIIGNRLTLFYIFFLLSLFVSEVNLDIVNAYIEEYVPIDLANRTAKYRTEEALMNLKAQGQELSWHAKYYRNALHWSLCLFLIVLYWKSKSVFLQNKRLLGLLSFTFLLYGVANILSTLPSGGRFVTLASMLAVAFLAVYIQNNRQERLIRRLIPLTYPLLGLFILVAARIGFYQMSVTTLIGNPLLALFSIGENIPLNTLIK